MKIFFLFFLFSFYGNVFSQSKNEYCKKDIVIRYHSLPKKKCRKKSLNISFEGGFSDTITILLNNKMIERKFFKTDPSLGFSGGIEIETEKHVNIVTFEINEINVFELLIDERFEIIRIFKRKESWLVIYSNDTIEYE